MTDTSWMRVWWIAYNKRLFGGELTMPVFKTAELTHCGEYCEGTITLSVWIANRDKAHATLIHEMVHQWQHMNNLPLDHGHVFKEWAALIMVETGMEI